MPQERYSDLLKEMPRISKAVNDFKSEAVQQAAFQALVGALRIRQEGETQQDAEEPKTPERTTAKGGAPKPKKAEERAAAETRTQGGSASEKAQGITDEIKNRPNFDKIEERVLHGGNAWDQIRLVLLAHDDNLTTGEVLSVLQGGFDLAAKKSTISETLKRNSGSLLRTGPRKKGVRTGYKLSSPARRAAENWLRETLK